MAFTTVLSSRFTSADAINDSKSSKETENETFSLSSPTSPTLTSNKFLREYEHDRQRTKKAAELVKARARKEQGWATKLRGSRRGAGTGVFSEKNKKLRDEDVADSLDGIALALGESKGNARSDTSLFVSRSEVKLLDLVTPAVRKPRKGKGMSSVFHIGTLVLTASTLLIAEGDFEVIPHVRSVIVLDDNTSKDLDMEDTWELIHSDEEEGSVKTPSYADVITLSK